MKKVLLFFCIGCGISFAQDVQEYIIEQDSSKRNHRYALHRSDYSIPESEINEVGGSPYVDNRWQKGTASIEGKWSLTAPMRYNAEREIIEFLDSDGLRKEFVQDPLIQAEFGGKVFKTLKIREEGVEKMGYCNALMNSGSLRLYFRPKIKLLKRNNGTGSPWTVRDVYCINASSYYLYEEGKPARQIKKLNRKNLLAALDIHKDVLERYINGYKLNLRKEADVIRLLNFYNALSNPNIAKIQQNRS